MRMFVIVEIGVERGGLAFGYNDCLVELFGFQTIVVRLHQHVVCAFRYLKGKQPLPVGHRDVIGAKHLDIGLLERVAGNNSR